MYVVFRDIKREQHFAVSRNELDYAGDHTLGSGSIHLAKMVGSSSVVKGRKPQSKTFDK